MMGLDLPAAGVALTLKFWAATNKPDDATTAFEVRILPCLEGMHSLRIACACVRRSCFIGLLPIAIPVQAITTCSGTVTVVGGLVAGSTEVTNCPAGSYGVNDIVTGVTEYCHPWCAWPSAFTCVCCCLPPLYLLLSTACSAHCSLLPATTLLQPPGLLLWRWICHCQADSLPRWLVQPAPGHGCIGRLL